MLTEQSIGLAYEKLCKLIDEAPDDPADQFDSMLAEVGRVNPMIAKIIRNEIAIANEVPHPEDDEPPSELYTEEEANLMAVAMVRLAYLITQGEIDDPEQQDRALREDTE